MKCSKNKYWVSEWWPNGDEAREAYFNSFEELELWLKITFPYFAPNISITDLATNEDIYISYHGRVKIDTLNLKRLIVGE